MELRFLGTSAGEGYPARWCACTNCDFARRSGGRNLRSNSAAWLAPGIGIDFGPDVFHQAQKAGVDLVDLTALFITHTHRDHLYPTHLFWRRMQPSIALPPPLTVAGPRFSPLPMLHLYGGPAVRETLDRYAEASGLPSICEDANRELYRLTFHEVAYGETQITRQGLAFTAIQASHLDRSSNGLNYIFHLPDGNVLYALDTGMPLETSWATIRGHRYSIVVLDLTFGFGEGTPRHLNLARFRETHARFRSEGLLAPGAIFCGSHIGPHFSPPHDEYSALLAPEGIVVAYDGMRLAI